MEAAELVDGTAVFSTFAPSDQAEQKFCDFNGLADKSTLNAEAVKRQVGSVVKKVSGHKPVVIVGYLKLICLAI